MSRVSRLSCGAAVGLLFTVAPPCLAQQSPVRFINETYFSSGPDSRGLDHDADWTELHANLGDRYSCVFSQFRYDADSMLDEDYLKCDENRFSLRAGRMRSAFGFGSWSDLWYNPVISMPICRFMPLANGVSLGNFNSGIELKTWNGPLQGELAFLDLNPSESRVLPRSMNFERARVQMAKGSLLLGINALVSNGDLSSNASDVLGLDYRWTSPRVIVRGEAMRGYGASAGRGYYTDCTYRPPRFFRTELGGRVEGYESSGMRAHLYTAGVRQIMSPNLALTLDYSWGSVPDFLYSMRGWHLETSFGVRVG